MSNMTGPTNEAGTSDPSQAPRVHPWFLIWLMLLNLSVGELLFYVLLMFFYPFLIYSPWLLIIHSVFKISLPLDFLNGSYSNLVLDVFMTELRYEITGPCQKSFWYMWIYVKVDWTQLFYECFDPLPTVNHMWGVLSHLKKMRTLTFDLSTAWQETFF